MSMARRFNGEPVSRLILSIVSDVEAIERRIKAKPFTLKP